MGAVYLTLNQYAGVINNAVHGAAMAVTGQATRTTGGAPSHDSTPTRQLGATATTTDLMAVLARLSPNLSEANALGVAHLAVRLGALPDANHGDIDRILMILSAVVTEMTINPGRRSDAQVQGIIRDIISPAVRFPAIGASTTAVNGSGPAQPFHRRASTLEG